MKDDTYPVIEQSGKLHWGPAKGGGNRPAKGNVAADGPEGTARRRREKELLIAEKAMMVFDDVLSLAPGRDGPTYRDKIAAASYIYDKAFGKATQATTVSVAVVDPKTVSDEELMRIALQRDAE